ncbi:MAG: efflux RND transporter periplasmic adaptor subunit, partial [Pirellulaceae bacterium]
ASVRLVPAEKRSVQSTSEFVATLIPNRRATMGSAVDGRVLEYNIEAGQPVAAGEGLAQLRTATIEIEIAAAKAELRLRSAELEELQNGALVEELQQAEARLASTSADLELAKSRVERARSLDRVSGAISAEELDAVQSQLAKAEQMQIEAKSAFKLMNDGPRREQIEQAQARVDAQAEMVRLLEDRLLKYTVRTPFEGYVVLEHTQAGAWVKQGDPVADVVSIDPIKVEAHVPEANIPFVTIGDEVTCYSETLQQEFTATVKRIVPEADRRARTFPVILEANNPKDTRGVHLLRPGMLVRVKLPSGPQREAIVVPKDSIVLGGQTPIVFKSVDGKATPIPVRMGAASDEMVEVNSEISEGDLVVTKGNERLRPGQPLNVLK